MELCLTETSRFCGKKEAMYSSAIYAALALLILCLFTRKLQVVWFYHAVFTGVGDQTTIINPKAE